METRSQILVTGIVQGVGFRPYIYSLARRRQLRGKVFNNESGVFIDVEGDAGSIDAFINELRVKPPPLSTIDSVEHNRLATRAYFDGFQIVSSESQNAKAVPIAADVSVCADCIREMFDSNDRRYRYPFINCTNCGPRFTLVESVPYDREGTTMRDFEMCSHCRAEYEDPENRRFHAEPICCPGCGPALSLFPNSSFRNSSIEENKRPINPDKPGSRSRSDFIGHARGLLQNGKILAIKGLGGFHLACDALNADAVERLRRRKFREDKPFALMAGTPNVIKKYCLVSEAEEVVLSSAQRPIVLLERKPDAKIPYAVAPRLGTLGFMLPYTPLHYLLFENFGGPLVMTSGNISDEPIAYTDQDANERLKDIADYYLLHDRRIHIRTDDSVVRIFGDTETRSQGDTEKKLNLPHAPHVTASLNRRLSVLRRSRGFAPVPVKTSFKFKTQILACGAELKNTFCLTRGAHAYISHHIGDLENLETLQSFTTGIEHFKRLFDLRPDVIAHDLHPEYLSTKYALACDEIENKMGVQHHHAHIASCMADNGVEGEVIGVAMDGLGFGTDGKLWGGEFFVADFKHAERIAHLDYVPLPGAAKAIREPWRLAAVYLQRTFGDDFLNLNLPFVKGLKHAEWQTLRQMSETGTNSPETSSMGRLFDAVSALLGVRNVVNYEGQAAIELEAIADKTASGSYEFEVAEGGIIKAEPIIKRVVEDLLDRRSAGEVSASFHLSIAELIRRVSLTIREARNLNRVALSGGVFQNMTLLHHACRRLESDGFEVLIHRRVPTNDGGISFGQAAIANAHLM